MSHSGGLRLWTAESTSMGFDAEPTADSERSDIEASVKGDGDAFARLILRHQDAVTAWMWRFSRDRKGCEDLVHDVFVEAYFSLSRFRYEAPFAHWLRKIAVRVGYRHWRELSRERQHGAVDVEKHADSIEAPGGRMNCGVAADLVHVLLGRLAPRDRLVLTLLHIEELSVQEAAEAAGWSRAMIKVQAYRARQKFRRLLEEHERSAGNE